MLAALIATRVPAPPPPSIPFYTNQLVAAVTTFSCLTIARRCAALTTDLYVRYSLDLSRQGMPAITDVLAMRYSRIINYLSSNANIIGMPSDLYLSDQIASVVATVVTMTSTLATLPVALQDEATLILLQQQLATNLAVLRTLAK